MTFRIGALVAETEGLLRSSLRLDPVSIEPDLARAEGSFKGAPVFIETRVFAGPSVAFARFVLLHGGSGSAPGGLPGVTGSALEIGNILCLGRPSLPLPIFGADLVAISPESAMFAADLSPVVSGDEGDRLLEPLARRRALHAPLPPGGELPAWCSAWFSPFALYTRIRAAEGPAASAAYLDFARAFLDIERAAAPDPARAGAVAAAQSSYLEAHRTEDKGLTMLSKIFGEAWASRYIDRVLFPAQGGDRINQE